jgi:uncharacterized protein YqjF (DUF2071 family)
MPSPEPVRVEPVDAAAPALTGPVMMTQDWRDLTFLHWAVEPERVRRLMPPGVRPDVIDGRTYVGLVPFRMVDAGLLRGPRVPWAGTFLETNVRLYSVDDTGRRGIVFLSLDTDRSVVVLGARAAFGLPYRWSRMRHEVTREGGLSVHRYESRLRRSGVRPRSHVVVSVGAPRRSSTLDTFLSARWGLHVRWLGRTLYVPNRHDPWPLRDAEVVSLDDELLSSVGLGEIAAREPDHLAFSDGVHTEFGFPTSASRARRDVTQQALSLHAARRGDGRSAR